MKKVIFICLLSLTTCLSRPDGAPVGAPVLAASNPAPAAQGTPPTTPAPADPAAPKEQAPQNASPPPQAASLPSTNAPQPAAPAAPAAPAQAPAHEPTQTNRVTPTTAPPHADATTDGTATQNNITNKDAPVPNGTKPDATTTAPANPKTNEPADKNAKGSSVPDKDNKKNDSVPASTVHPPKAIEAAGRGFDGPSFLGGMILTLGLLAIGFMGFKYYRNQTERNYHTL